MLIKTPVCQTLGVVLLSYVLPIASFPGPATRDTASLFLKSIHNVPGPQNLENLAVRHNGDILVTSATSSSLHQVSPTKSSPSIRIAEIPGVISLFGIAEMEKDVFYVIGSNLSALAVSPGSTGVWKVDMRNFRATQDGTIRQPAEISMVTLVPSANLFNGMCRLAPNDTSNLLISDSAAGTVTKLNVETGAYETVIQDPTMAISATGLPIGINGVHVHRGTLFFTNFNQGLFAKVPISLSTGLATGPVEVVANVPSGDDFALSRDGTKAWIAINGQNTLVQVDIPAKTARIAANSTLLMSAAAVALGRTYSDHSSLYITGAAIVNGTAVGHVVRADLSLHL